MFVERLWRSVRYEELYLRAYDSMRDARASLGQCLDSYNGRRPQSSLGARTPEQAYLDYMHQRVAAGTGRRCRGAGKTCVSTGSEATHRNRNAVARNRATSIG